MQTHLKQACHIPTVERTGNVGQQSRSQSSADDVVVIPAQGGNTKV